MPKAKPVSLWPLSFDEAITGIIRVDPEKVGLGHKKIKSVSKRPPVTKQQKG